MKMNLTVASLVAGIIGILESEILIFSNSIHFSKTLGIINIIGCMLGVIGTVIAKYRKYIGLIGIGIAFIVSLIVLVVTKDISNSFDFICKLGSSIIWLGIGAIVFVMYRDQ
ncbi:MAG: hypothetical protein ACRDCB_01125 [Clostridium sp.]